MNDQKRSITWEQVQKSRLRLSQENGTVVKDWGGKIPFAFIYPESYYVGMSNLGLQAVYGLLNNSENILCERVFWDEDNKRQRTMPLSVESQRPLTDFAVLAFSINYEIDYFNIAPILQTSGIPLYSSERDETQPLIIAGGPCITANPMPVAPFFDCLCIGEAEVLLPDMLPILTERISINRDDLLKALCCLPGVFVPSHPPGDHVVRQWVKNLDMFDVHSVVLASDTELKDMYLIEVQRGCAHGCRFCLVSNTFGPMRFHSVDKLLMQGREGLKYSRRLGLVGPAVTDHPRIDDLLTDLLKMGAYISISSLRISSLTPLIMEMLVKGGLRSIALAPEAGSECLRQSVKKGIHEEDILRAIDTASHKGIEQIKLYFMIGLPEETEEDIQAIVSLTLAGKQIIEKKRSKTRLTLNVSPFVPKAGTPFERFPMESIDLLDKRLGVLKSKLSHQGIRIKNESPQWSEVQTVLSRGDRQITNVLVDLDRGSINSWRLSTQKHDIDVNHIAHQKWDLHEQLPWEIIH